MPLFDSEPALAEGERKVKRGLTGVVSAVPRLHLPTVRGRLLPRHPHLPSTAWAPRGTLNRPRSASKTLLLPLVPLALKPPTWCANTDPKAPPGHPHQRRKVLADPGADLSAERSAVVEAQWLRFCTWLWISTQRMTCGSCNPLTEAVKV